MRCPAKGRRTFAALRRGSPSRFGVANGTVRVELWSAIGNGPMTVGVGNQSRVVLPLA